MVSFTASNTPNYEFLIVFTLHQIMRSVISSERESIDSRSPSHERIRPVVTSSTQFNVRNMSWLRERRGTRVWQRQRRYYISNRARLKITRVPLASMREVRRHRRSGKPSSLFATTLARFTPLIVPRACES